MTGLTDDTAEKMRTLCAGPDELRARRANAGQRAEIIKQLAGRGIDFQQAALQAGKPDADPFDLHCHLAFKPTAISAVCSIAITSTKQCKKTL